MNSTVSSFWRRWMLIVALSMTIMGLIITFTPLIHNTLAPIYYNTYFDHDAYSTLSNGDLRFQAFVYGITGAVLASWSILIAFLVAFPLRQGQRWAWIAIALSLIIWFIGDGYASVVTGFEVHALLNLSLLVMMGIPLLVTYHQIR